MPDTSIGTPTKASSGMPPELPDMTIAQAPRKLSNSAAATAHIWTRSSRALATEASAEADKHLQQLPRGMSRGASAGHDGALDRVEAAGDGRGGAELLGQRVADLGP